MEKQERSFTIVHAAHRDGCPTKFSRKDYSGRYVSKNPGSAASKAGTELCSSKRVKGQCTLYIKMRETTRGSKGKEFMYHVKREKLANPIEITKGVKVYYKNRVISVDDNEKPKCKKSHKSSGRMTKHKSKKSKVQKSKKTKKNSRR